MDYILTSIAVALLLLLGILRTFEPPRPPDLALRERQKAAMADLDRVLIEGREFLRAHRSRSGGL